LGWNAAAQFSVQVLQFGTSVAIARLLGPQELGLMAMIMVFTGFAAIFYDMGLGSALIQRKDLSEGHLNSVFWINAGTGALMTVLFMASAPLIARFYGQPALRLLTMVVSLTFIPAALGVVQVSVLGKELNFRARFWIETISTLVSGALAVFMALTGAGIWSLVAQSLSLAALRFVITWHISTWRPTWSFDPEAFRELFKFSRNVLANGAVQYWGRNVDRLLLGRFIGSAGVGLYGLAFRSITLPLELTTNVTNSVMFPVFAAIQGDADTLRRAYLRSICMIALLTFPLMIGLAVLANPLVLFLYGDKWRASIGIVQILAFSGIAQSVYNTAAWLFLSQGRSDILLWLGVYASVVRVCGVIAGIHWGAMGVAWAYLIGTYLFLLYPTWLFAGRLLNLGFDKLLLNLAEPFLSASGMGAAVWMCDQWVFGHLAPWLRVATGVPCGILIYSLLIYLFQGDACGELKFALLEVGGKKFPILRRAFAPAEAR
jgi:PST family polysaccharide transporter